MLSYLVSMRLVERSFTTQAKWIKLHGARVVGGETMDRKKTLNKVRSYQHIIEVKWPGKHRVAY
jgi:hypothetical protein